jgi:Putative threonine efflux protein
MLIPLLKGFIVGLGASIPLGPLGVLCVQKTLSKGRNSGFFTGLGASASDTFYAGISLLGLAFVQNLIKDNSELVMIVGGIIIMLVGLRIYLKNPIKQIRQKHSNKKHVEDFFEGLFMTVTNPGAIVLILGLFAAVGIDTTDESANKATIFSILWGVFLGTSFWWFTLSTTINVFRKRFRLKQLITINKVSGIIIFALGIISLFTGIYEIMLPLFK